MWCRRVGHDGHRLWGDTHRPAYLPERSDGAGGRVEYSGDRTPGECRQGYGQSLAACAGPTLSRRDELFGVPSTSNRKPPLRWPLREGGQITAQNVDTAQFRGAGDGSEGAFTPRTEPNCVVIWQSRTSHVITEETLGGVSAGCKPLQTIPKIAMATLNGGFRATVLTTPATPDFPVQQHFLIKN